MATDKTSNGTDDYLNTVDNSITVADIIIFLIETLSVIIKYSLYAAGLFLILTLFTKQLSFADSLSVMVSFVFVDIPSAIFTSIVDIGSFFKNIYTVNGEGYEWVSWIGSIIEISSVLVAISYYIFVFLLFATWWNNAFSNNSLTPEEVSDYLARLNARQAGVLESSGAADNESLWAFGLTSNQDIIDAKVQANAIADALSKMQR